LTPPKSMRASIPLLSRGGVQISEAVRKRHALLSQEGSAARRVARGEVPELNLVGTRLWNLLSRDLDDHAVLLTQEDVTRS
jgi:hypothetical protein